MYSEKSEFDYFLNNEWAEVIDKVYRHFYFKQKDYVFIPPSTHSEGLRIRYGTFLHMLGKMVLDADCEEKEFYLGELIMTALTGKELEQADYNFSMIVSPWCPESSAEMAVDESMKEILENLMDKHSRDIFELYLSQREESDDCD